MPLPESSRGVPGPFAGLFFMPSRPSLLSTPGPPIEFGPMGPPIGPPPSEPPTIGNSGFIGVYMFSPPELDES